MSSTPPWQVLLTPCSNSSSKLSPRSCLTQGRLPQANGDERGGGASLYRAMTPKNFATAPSCAQVARTRRPPERQTRASSAAASAWLPANMTPNVEMTPSKAPSSNGTSPHRRGETRLVAMYAPKDRRQRRRAKGRCPHPSPPLPCVPHCGGPARPGGDVEDAFPFTRIQSLRGMGERV